MFTRVLSLAFGLTALLLASADATPTPVPGGANALVALSAKSGQTVFNGVLRIQIVELRDATDADGSDQPRPGADQKVMVMRSLLRNGSHDRFTDLLTYTLADKDAVTVDIPSSQITHANPNILQGASLRQSARFLVDKDFVPTNSLSDAHPAVRMRVSVRSASRSPRTNTEESDYS